MRRRNKLKGKKLSDRIFLLLAICLAIYAFMAKKEPASTPPPNRIADTEKESSLADHFSGSLELKDYPYGTVLDFKQGEGALVQCGQEVQVRYRTLLLDGTPLEDFLEKGAPVQLKIGESNLVIPGVVHYTMGMRLGAERQVTLPPEMAYDLPAFRRKDVPLGSSVMLRLKLMGVKEDSALEAKGYKLFNIVQALSRKQAWCGEEVSVLVHNVTGRNVKDLLPSAEGYTTQFVLGNRSVPLWLEQAVVGDGAFKPIGLGGHRGIHISDEMTGSKAFLEWEGAPALKTKAGEEAVLRVQLIAVGSEKIEVQEPKLEEEAQEGWKHDKTEDEKEKSAEPEVKTEAAPAEEEKAAASEEEKP